MERHLDHDGRRLTVRSSRSGRLGTAVTLLADDVEVGHGVQDGIAPVRIPLDDAWTLEADSLVPGRLRRCELQRDGETVPFPPPAGTLAARAYEHPRLWAARHVVGGVGQVLVAVLGIGLLVRGLLPHVDLPSVDLPDLPLPDLFGWLPDVRLPDLPDLPDLHTRYWLPVLIAVVVATREYRRRRRRDGD